VLRSIRTIEDAMNVIDFVDYRTARRQIIAQQAREQRARLENERRRAADRGDQST
jgi:hypothetical protein